MARDAYSYIHFPMVAGIVLGSLGLKKVLEYVGDESHHELSEPLAMLPLIGMFGGVALYLLAHVAFRYRIWHHITWHRVVVAVLALALIPVGAQLPALAALGLVATVMVCLIVYESLKLSEFRERVRHEDDALGAGHPEHT